MMLVFLIVSMNDSLFWILLFLFWVYLLIRGVGLFLWGLKYKVGFRVGESLVWLIFLYYCKKFVLILMFFKFFL